MLILKTNWGEMDYRFHAAHLDRGLTIHEAVPGGFNRAGKVYEEDPDRE